MISILAFLFNPYFPFQLYPTASSRDVIYGDDNRIDWYQVSNPMILEQARATPALFFRKFVKQLESGDYELLTNPYAKLHRLCPEEPFYNQPAGAVCTGFLMNETTVVTAGHCIRKQEDCDKTLFIFDYRMENESEAHLIHPPQNVYACKTLIASKTFKNAVLDYAVATVDRPVLDRPPLKLRQSGELLVGDPLYVLGYPAGLPWKMAGGATVREPAEEKGYFVANLDTYGGNSGSPVIHAETHEVEGILVRGETDYVYDQERQCYHSNVCSPDGCGGEEATVIEAIF